MKFIHLMRACVLQNADSLSFSFSSTDSTPHEIFLVVEDRSNNEKRLHIVQLDPDPGELSSVGHIPYLNCPSVMVSFAGKSSFSVGAESVTRQAQFSVGEIGTVVDLSMSWTS